MNTIFSIHWLLIATAWYFINGLLHDVFVIKAHKGPYDRELLRLLMDGHVLMLSGAVLLVCWWMLRANIIYGAVIGLIVAISMLVYCLMIFPFLKSMVTMLLSTILAIACIFIYRKLSA